MKPTSHCGRLPNINLKRLLAGSKPPLVQHEKKNFKRVNIDMLKYLIWCSTHTDIGIKNLARQVGSDLRACRGWLNAYGVDCRVATHPDKTSDADAAKMKRLFDKGMNFTEIGRKFGVRDTTVTRVAKRDGWYERTTRNFSWQVRGRFAPNTIATYGKYCRTIRHVTNVMCFQYSTVVDPLKQKGKHYHVDHRLSIYDAFNAGDVPLPWQMVCHPANLVLISSSKNRGKGASSSIGPNELKKEIARFEVEHGAVRLPVIVGENKAGRFIYNVTAADTMAARIAKDSKITLRQARQIFLEGRKCPPLEFRQQFRREHYEYVLFAFSKGRINRKMAYDLGCSANAIKRVMDRIGLTQPTATKISLVVRLAEKGRTIKYVAEKLGITPLEALCLYQTQRSK